MFVCKNDYRPIYFKSVLSCVKIEQNKTKSDKCYFQKSNQYNTTVIDDSYDFIIFQALERLIALMYFYVILYSSHIDTGGR